MSSAAGAGRDPQVTDEEDIRRARQTLTRVGTSLAWQWMCTHGNCGYALSINRDMDDIAKQAARHIEAHGTGSDPRPNDGDPWRCAECGSRREVHIVGERDGSVIHAWQPQIEEV